MTERLFVRLCEDDLQGPESGVPRHSLELLPVHTLLRPYVVDVLSFNESFDPGEEVLERILPDGAVRVILHLTGKARDGRPMLEVAGPSAAPTLIRLQGRVQGLSLALRAGAARALLGVPAGELAERVVSFDDLWPREAGPLLDRLATARDCRSLARALQDALLSRRARDRAIDSTRVAACALSAIRVSGGRQRLSDVAASLGVGERRLQQVFHEHVGLRPKAVSRLARMHALLRALRQSASTPWSQLAPELGFYDQAHLVNEFRALSGLTPAQFLVRATASASSNTRS